VLEAQFGDDASKMGVQVDRIEEVGGEPRSEFNPGHPLADEEGYIYRPNIDVATEMVNMMQASRSFQNSIEAINTAKQLAMRTLTLGK
jgi:flagellar basal-body rod protein FlgC